MRKNTGNREKEKQELDFIMTCLFVICGSCVFIALLRVLLLGMGDTSAFWPRRLPDLVTLGVMAACCVVIYKMLVHVRRGEVFSRRNSSLVIGVGMLVELNGIFQLVFQFFVPGDGAVYPSYMIYILLGVFFLFIGCLFRLAVYIKEEQELTI